MNRKINEGLDSGFRVIRMDVNRRTFGRAFLFYIIGAPFDESDTAFAFDETTFGDDDGKGDGWMYLLMMELGTSYTVYCPTGARCTTLILV